jgi:hypothetical protein
MNGKQIGPQSTSRSLGEEENLLPLVGIEPCPASSVVTVSTELPGLLHKIINRNVKKNRFILVFMH